MSDRLSRISARVIRWLKPPRTLAINPLGWYFIAFVFAVGLAAVNTGNNLLYLILGGMLSFIVASGILSNINLKKLVITRHLPEHLFARTPTMMRVGIENHKRHTPSFILLVQDANRAAVPALVPTVVAQKNADGFIEVVFPRRGLYTMVPIKVTTRFPFGLFTKGMEAAAGEHALVFPHLAPADAGDLDSRGREGETIRTQSGQGSEPFSITDFHPGDNPRHIHWKSTAKRGKLMRREFTKEQEPAVSIRVAASPADTDDVLEEKIERAAGLSARYTADGFSVAVECGSAAVSFGRGADHLMVILRELALCDVHGAPEDGKRITGGEGAMVVDL